MKFTPGHFSSIDLLLAPLYIIVLFIIFFYFKPKNVNFINAYKKGFFLKITGGVAFWFLHCALYGGGDSYAYFYSSKALGNLLFEDFVNGFLILTGEIKGFDILSYFNSNTGFPAGYMSRDFHTFSVARYSTIFTILGLNSFLLSTILISAFSYIGVWKFYRMISEIYPDNKGAFFYLVLCMPSLLFWGGGIMKDTYVLSATCWFSHSFYKIFIQRKKIYINSFFILINLFIIINIKPYIILSLIPGALLWLNNAYARKIKNSFIRVIIIPVFFILTVIVGALTFNNINEYMGNYADIDQAIHQAQVIQQDLLRSDQYGNNNYNLGRIDGSISGMARVAPAAVFTAIFRPLPWEVGSPTMIISAVENSLMLIFTVFLIIRLNPVSFFRLILKEPFVFFAFSFSLVFAFGVGIASTNFGALARYKIPLIPFFFTALYIIYSLKNKKTQLF